MNRGTPTTFAIALLSAVGLNLAANVACAQQSVEAFYRGATVYLDIGLPPGGGYDLYGRVFARYAGRHIPGNPNIVTRNMEGAGGLRAANHYYNAAPRDGAHIALIQAPVIMQAYFGDPAVQFDAQKFTWIGSLNKDLSSCGVWSTSGVNSFDDIFKREVSFGASGAGGMLAQHPLIFKNLLGAKAKVIMGYKGSNDVNLAMERSEVDGACAIFASTLKTRWRDDWKAGRLKIIIQVGPDNDPDFGDAPNIFSYAKTPEDRQLMQLLFGQSIMGRPILAPPNIPTDRRDALRKAMLETLRDPDFKAEAEKLFMDFNPATGPEIEALLAEYKSYPATIANRARVLLQNY